MQQQEKLPTCSLHYLINAERQVEKL